MAAKRRWSTGCAEHRRQVLQRPGVIFTRHGLNLTIAETELASFKVWLSGKSFIGEREIVRQIRNRPHMTCLLGPTGSISAPNLIRWELPFGGLYKADLALGNDHRRQFMLVEFEGAEEISLFRNARTAQYRYWGAHLEHGFGQLLDWASYFSYNKRDAALAANFGGRIDNCTYLVICGRDAGILDQMERERFTYRRAHVQVEGVQSQILTYDEMAVAMTNNLEIWRS